jgi:hypothetical protein
MRIVLARDVPALKLTEQMCLVAWCGAVTSNCGSDLSGPRPGILHFGRSFQKRLCPLANGSKEQIACIGMNRALEDQLIVDEADLASCARQSGGLM